MNRIARYFIRLLIVCLIISFSIFFSYFFLPRIEQMLFFFSSSYDRFFFYHEWDNYVSALIMYLLMILLFIWFRPLLFNRKSSQKERHKSFYRLVQWICFPSVILLSMGQLGNHVLVDSNGLVHRSILGLKKEQITWKELEEVKVDWTISQRSKYFTPQYQINLSSGNSIDLWEWEMIAKKRDQQLFASASEKLREIEKTHHMILPHILRVEAKKCFATHTLYKMQQRFEQSDWIASLYPKCSS